MAQRPLRLTCQDAHVEHLRGDSHCMSLGMSRITTGSGLPALDRPSLIAASALGARSARATAPDDKHTVNLPAIVLVWDHSLGPPAISGRSSHCQIQSDDCRGDLKTYATQLRASKANGSVTFSCSPNRCLECIIQNRGDAAGIVLRSFTDLGSRPRSDTHACPKAHRGSRRL